MQIFVQGNKEIIRPLEVFELARFNCMLFTFYIHSSTNYLSFVFKNILFFECTNLVG